MSYYVDGIHYSSEADIPEIFTSGDVRITAPIELPGNIHTYEADDPSIADRLPMYCGDGSKCLCTTGELITFNATKKKWKVFD